MAFEDLWRRAIDDEDLDTTLVAQFNDKYLSTVHDWDNEYETDDWSGYKKDFEELLNHYFPDNKMQESVISDGFSNIDEMVGSLSEFIERGSGGPLGKAILLRTALSIRYSQDHVMSNDIFYTSIGSITRRGMISSAEEKTLLCILKDKKWRAYYLEDLTYNTELIITNTRADGSGGKREYKLGEFQQILLDYNVVRREGVKINEPTDLSIYAVKLREQIDKFKKEKREATLDLRSIDDSDDIADIDVRSKLKEYISNWVTLIETLEKELKELGKKESKEIAVSKEKQIKRIKDLDKDIQKTTGLHRQKIPAEILKITDRFYSPEELPLLIPNYDSSAVFVHMRFININNIKISISFFLAQAINYSNLQMVGDIDIPTNTRRHVSFINYLRRMVETKWGKHNGNKVIPLLELKSETRKQFGSGLSIAGGGMKDHNSYLFQE